MAVVVRGYHHLSLSVRDLDRSVDWYRAVLGLEVAAQMDGDGFRRTRLGAPGGELILTLTSHEQRDDGPFDERRTGMDHVAFAVEPGGVAALKARCEELGVEHSEVKESSSGRPMLTFRDPDNIQLEVFE